ncbi:MAG: hypothetical protein AABX59_02480, partial [Nanoarchaeota archaeon]
DPYFFEDKDVVVGTRKDLGNDIDMIIEIKKDRTTLRNKTLKDILEKESFSVGGALSPNELPWKKQPYKEVSVSLPYIVSYRGKTGGMGGMNVLFGESEGRKSELSFKEGSDPDIGRLPGWKRVILVRDPSFPLRNVFKPGKEKLVNQVRSYGRPIKEQAINERPLKYDVIFDWAEFTCSEEGIDNYADVVERGWKRVTLLGDYSFQPMTMAELKNEALSSAWQDFSYSVAHSRNDLDKKIVKGRIFPMKKGSDQLFSVKFRSTLFENVFLPNEARIDGRNYLIEIGLSNPLPIRVQGEMIGEGEGDWEKQELHWSSEAKFSLSPYEDKIVQMPLTLLSEDFISPIIIRSPRFQRIIKANSRIKFKEIILPDLLPQDN